MENPQVTSTIGDFLPEPEKEYYKNDTLQDDNHCPLTVSRHLIWFKELVNDPICEE